MGSEWDAHLICRGCWNATKGTDREPVVVRSAPVEPCCVCGRDNSDGIYIRAKNEWLRCDGTGVVHADDPASPEGGNGK